MAVSQPITRRMIQQAQNLCKLEGHSSRPKGSLLHEALAVDNHLSDGIARLASRLSICDDNDQHRLPQLLGASGIDHQGLQHLPVQI